MMAAEHDPIGGMRSVDIEVLADAGLLNAGKHGTLTWPQSGSTDIMRTFALKGALRLTYVETLSNSETTLQYIYDVPLKRVRRHRGPERVLFLCPLCKKEVRSLFYVRPGGGFFLCEECQGMVDEESRTPGHPKLKRPYVRKTPLVLTPRNSESEAFCCKCRDRREIIDPKPIMMANGRPAMQGTCVVCGTKAARIVVVTDSSFSERGI